MAQVLSYPRTDGMTPSRPVLRSSLTDGTVEFTGMHINLFRLVWFGFLMVVLASSGGWVVFLVVVIARSGRLLCNDVVSGLVFQGLPSHFFSFSIYFEIDK